MRRVVLFTMAVLLAAGVAFAKEYEVKKKAGDFDLVIRIDKNPPVTGDNKMTIAVRDSAGKAVQDAEVRVEYSMPPMPGMPPMNYKTETTRQGDDYLATMNLSMAGPWNIAVKVTRAGKTAGMKFTVDAK